MDENKILLDEALSNVTGGKIYNDSIWRTIELQIKFLKDHNVPNGKQIMINTYRSIWEEEGPSEGADWTDLSTDRSQEDLDSLLAFIEEKWEE